MEKKSSDIESQITKLSNEPYSNSVSQSIEELYEIKVESRGPNVTNPPFIGAQLKKHDLK